MSLWIPAPLTDALIATIVGVNFLGIGGIVAQAATWTIANIWELLFGDHGAVTSSLAT